jgi:hypothetical protein
MMPTPADCHVLAKVLAGKPLDGEREAVSGHFRRLVDRLDELRPEKRRDAFDGFLLSCSADAATAVIKAVADIDTTGPVPSPEVKRLTAHLGDLAGDPSHSRFVWPNRLVRGHFNLLSSDPKIGKTYVTMDLARRLWHGLPWPDGQDQTLPEGTKTLWIAGDRHQDELREYAASFGLPLEAILLNASPAEPYGGWDLDDPENVASLRERIEADKPGLVIIDTLWRATRRKLHVATEVNDLINPLIAIAQELDVAFLALMHLSKGEDGKGQDTLGRRLEGLARSIMKMFKPDPEQPNRRKLVVTGNFKEPPPLGVTLRDGRCDFDFNPPEERAPGKRGRPPEKQTKAIEFLEEKLTAGDRKGCELIKEWEEMGESKATLFNARDAMQEDGRLVVDDSKKPQIWHLAGDHEGHESQEIEF